MKREQSRSWEWKEEEDGKGGGEEVDEDDDDRRVYFAEFREKSGKVTHGNTLRHIVWEGNIDPPVVEPSPSTGFKFADEIQLGRDRVANATQCVVARGRIEMAGDGSSKPARPVTDAPPVSADGEKEPIAYIEWSMRLVGGGGETHIKGRDMDPPQYFGGQRHLFIDSVCEITETFVPPALRGKGLADSLTRSAFKELLWNSCNIRYASKIRPTCSYTRDTFLTRNPEYKEDCVL